ncbi:hypothetical protein ACFXGI_16800 [Streptomyces sp. NPDC059355]|uniref:hypothetical protein n=1 Tax=Streptomyces sp. NPDC059355 TaxID=3346811 RepID=UPI0036AB79EC
MTGQVEHDPGSRQALLRVAVPSAPACTAALGTGSVWALMGGGLVSTDSPAAWPLVVLALGCMAYDLGTRALHRREPRSVRDCP